MITFKEFLKESQSPKITPSLGEIESYEWVTDKELMPDSVIDYLKRPIMWSYDNKSHNIIKINSIKYLNDKCIVLCEVILDNKEKVELKVYHGFGGVICEETNPFKGIVTHNKEFSQNDLETKYKSGDMRRIKGTSSEEDFRI